MFRREPFIVIPSDDGWVPSFVDVYRYMWLVNILTSRSVLVDRSSAS